MSSPMTAPQPTLATHNGTLTLRNPTTGNHRTFRIRTQPQTATFAPGRRVISLLTGPDNTSAYTGFGFVGPDGRVLVWRSKRAPEADPATRTLSVWETYASMLNNLQALLNANRLTAHLEGRCRRCNRTLTTPASIESGIGPVCEGGR